MFICDTCLVPSKPYEKRNAVVTQTRAKTYTKRDADGNAYVAGYGREIVQETQHCTTCALTVKFGREPSMAEVEQAIAAPGAGAS